MGPASRSLGLVLLVGCAAGSGPDHAPAAAVGTDSTDADVEIVCDRQGAVLVHVDNQSTMDVELSFGSYTAARAAPGMSQTVYRVLRTYLQDPIRVRILRGGLQQGSAPVVATEPVMCNDATLIIGAEPRYSFFYGDLVPPARVRRDDSTHSTSPINRDSIR